MAMKPPLANDSVPDISTMYTLHAIRMLMPVKSSRSSVTGAPCGLRPVPPSGNEPLWAAGRGSCTQLLAHAEQAARAGDQDADHEQPHRKLAELAQADLEGEGFDQARQDAAHRR